MKKLLFSALVLALAVTSCKKDDDGGDDRNCQTCDLTAQGTTVTSRFCDNGDGTMEVTTGGQTQTQSLSGQTFAEFILTYEQLGATCN